MVKEFETGSGVSLSMVLQRTEGTEIGDQETSTFEAMCGHALYLATDYAKKGAVVSFPTEEPKQAGFEHAEVRQRAFRRILTDIMPTHRTSISQDLASLRGQLKEGETVALFVAIPDPDLPGVILSIPDVQFVVLAYDPREYTAKPDPALRGASDPEYVAALERVGTRVIAMPRQERVG